MRGSKMRHSRIDFGAELVNKAIGVSSESGKDCL